MTRVTKWFSNVVATLAQPPVSAGLGSSVLHGSCTGSVTAAVTAADAATEAVSSTALVAALKSPSCLAFTRRPEQHTLARQGASPNAWTPRHETVETTCLQGGPWLPVSDARTAAINSSSVRRLPPPPPAPSPPPSTRSKRYRIVPSMAMETRRRCCVCAVANFVSAAAPAVALATAVAVPVGARRLDVVCGRPVGGK